MYIKYGDRNYRLFFIFGNALILKESNSTTFIQNGEESPFSDPNIGHFCAPEIAGFCEAHLCIFHSSAAKQHNADVPSSSVLNVRDST